MQSDLYDETTIYNNDIIPGTTVSLAIWPYNGWPELVIAAATGDVFKLRHVISKPEPPCTCRSTSKGSMSGSPTWHSHRLFSALFICAHRGHLTAVRFLLQCGADVKERTPQGRGLLHAAASQGREETIVELLAQGSPLNMEDADGMTALSTATHFHQKKITRQLLLLHWQERAKGVRLKPHLDESELFAHQKRDSRLVTWYQGVRAQRYVAHLGRCSRGGEGDVGSRRLGPPQNTAVRAQARRAWIGGHVTPPR
ncbi:hypothetical protein DPEC_G00194250 [Dallia pectoralis]|uniref:Uncharacterized protein n=1 Tax=Dallia pectoralis TaxID=75939 RepID=A0ACC2G7C1_DALPE|nr:hypothetical protein DPEC_G00194250 [Dallia pectoralis]